MRTIRATTISILALSLLAGSAVGVAAQDEEAAAVSAFTGVARPDGKELPIEGTEVTLPNGFTESTPGFAWQDRWESSDPRFAGDHIVISNWVIDPNWFDPWSRGEQANILIATRHELTNDGGSWLGEGTSLASTDLDVAIETIVFVGRDGYAGLTAYAIIDNTRTPATFSGAIFPAAMPEFPEPYVAE